MDTHAQSVRIVEVGPRDGIQSLPDSIPTRTKLELIERLYKCGLQTIEITSAVSPKAIPQLADNQTVLGSDIVQRLFAEKREVNHQLRFPVLVPNTRGFKSAVRHGVTEVAVFVSASEGFSKANINCTVLEGLERARKVGHAARESAVAVRGYVSCVFACPYDGPTPHASVLQCVQQLLQSGCYEVSLGDTVGVGVASQVRSLLTYLISHGVPPSKLAGHFHDTYGQAVSNTWAAYECGLRVFDSSVAGLGGCPFAPGAKGNVATEDLVYLFEQAGISTGVDFDQLVDTGVWISKELGREYGSRAGAAIAVKTTSANLHEVKTELSSSQVDWNLLEDKEGVLVHRSGPNLRLTLNKPNNGNALTRSMIHRLTTIFSNAFMDDTITRIAICGAGNFFCTGMDLSSSSTAVARPDQGTASSTQFDLLTTLFKAIDEAPQVTIACINGPAFGGGVGLALACDIRIACAAASVTLSEVKLGLAPATISPYVVRELGVPFSREVMLSGRRVAASELHARGVVARQAESREELGILLDKLLTDLKTCAPRASVLCKKLVKVNSYPGSQDAEIRNTFEEMMGPEAEAAYGVKQFQAGIWKLDWDEYVQRKAVAKL